MQSNLQYKQDGDATDPGQYLTGTKYIIHCCNDIGAWGSGFVLALSKKWPKAEAAYKEWAANENGHFGLGMIQLVEVGNSTLVVNMVGQHGIASHLHRPPIRYKAIRKCLATLRPLALSAKATIHAPRFGSDRAGGCWYIIEDMIKKELCDHGIPVTIYTRGPLQANAEFEKMKCDKCKKGTGYRGIDVMGDAYCERHKRRFPFYHQPCPPCQQCAIEDILCIECGTELEPEEN